MGKFFINKIVTICNFLQLNQMETLFVNPMENFIKQDSEILKVINFY